MKETVVWLIVIFGSASIVSFALTEITKALMDARGWRTWGSREWLSFSCNHPIGFMILWKISGRDGE